MEGFNTYQCIDKVFHGKLAFFNCCHDFIYQVLIRAIDRMIQSAGNQMLGKARCEVFFATYLCQSRVDVKGTRGIDLIVYLNLQSVASLPALIGF